MAGCPLQVPTSLASAPPSFISYQSGRRAAHAVSGRSWAPPRTLTTPPAARSFRERPGGVSNTSSSARAQVKGAGLGGAWRRGVMTSTPRPAWRARREQPLFSGLVPALQLRRRCACCRPAGRDVTGLWRCGRGRGAGGGRLS